MNSIKLTNTDRDSIEAALINDFYNKNIKSLVDKAGDIATKIVWESYPKEVRSFITNHKEYTNVIDANIYITNFIGRKSYYRCPQISIKNCSRTITDGYYSIKDNSIFIKDKEFIKLIYKISELSDKSNILRNKIKCVLEHITTSKRLMEEFPEGYKVYYKDDDKKDDNICDSIENLRAELNGK